MIIKDKIDNNSEIIFTFLKQELSLTTIPSKSAAQKRFIGSYAVLILL